MKIAKLSGLSMPHKMKVRWYKELYVQVLVAIVCGALVGTFWPTVGVSLKPLGDALIKMIQMIIAPIIFLTVVHGIASMGDMKKAGRVGLKAIIYFELGTLAALVIGLVVINLLRPGDGMNITVASLDPKLVNSFIAQSHEETTVGFLLAIIPRTVVGAFANGEILPVLFFGILFALALQRFGERGKIILDFFDNLAKVFFILMGFIMRVAPFGAFGAMAFTVGNYGFKTIVTLSSFMLVFYLTCTIFIVIVLGGVGRMAGFSVFKLIRYLKEELLLVFGFSSSEPVLPRFMIKMEQAGCSPSVVGLVIPTGYVFNLDGTCIYLTMAAVFLAQATNTPLDLSQQIGLLLVCLLTSKGAAAIPGGGFIVLAATLGTIGHVPVASIALLLGIDRFMSEARALTNFIGTAVATIVVSRWEGELNDDQLSRAMERPVVNAELNKKSQ